MSIPMKRRLRENSPKSKKYVGAGRIDGDDNDNDNDTNSGNESVVADVADSQVSASESLSQSGIVIVDFRSELILRGKVRKTDFLFNESRATLTPEYSSYGGQSVYGGFQREIASDGVQWSAFKKVNGGLKVAWRSGTGVDLEAVSGLFMFKQNEFMNGLHVGNVYMDDSVIVSGNCGFINPGQVVSSDLRFVLKDSFGFFISESIPLRSNTLFSFRPKELTYEAYLPSVNTQTEAGSRIFLSSVTPTFSGITFVGLRIDAIRGSGRGAVNVGIQKIQVTALGTPTIALLTAANSFSNPVNTTPQIAIANKTPLFEEIIILFLLAVLMTCCCHICAAKRITTKQIKASKLPKGKTRKRHRKYYNTRNNQTIDDYDITATTDDKSETNTVRSDSTHDSDSQGDNDTIQPTDNAHDNYDYLNLRRYYDIGGDLSTIEESSEHGSYRTDFTDEDGQFHPMHNATFTQVFGKTRTNKTQTDKNNHFDLLWNPSDTSKIEQPKENQTINKDFTNNQKLLQLKPIPIEVYLEAAAVYEDHSTDTTQTEHILNKDDGNCKSIDIELEKEDESLPDLQNLHYKTANYTIKEENQDKSSGDATPKQPNSDLHSHVISVPKTVKPWKRIDFDAETVVVNNKSPTKSCLLSIPSMQNISY